MSRRMQMDDHRRKLVSVVVGRSIFTVMTVCWVNRGYVDPVVGSYCELYVSQVCKGRAVRNSESYVD